MKNVGIICEYNPLHGGHKYMISRLREMGAERIICLMSGNSVQRGDLAIIPKNIRARIAMAAGADAVFELPFPYCAASAEFFATAGVDILSRLGVDTVAFGSETGDIEILRELSMKAENYIPSDDKNIGTAEDYFAALGDLKSNDILGIEYLKAGKKLAPDLNFVTVKREGAGYHEDSADGSYPSATEIRRAILEGNIDNYSDTQIPLESKDAISEAILDGGIAMMKNVGAAVMFFWRSADTKKLSECAECGGGVAERLARASRYASSIDEMIWLAATKRYTYSRIRRATLFGFMGVRIEDLKRSAVYVNLLAANIKGVELIAGTRGIEIVAKPSNYPETEEGERQFELGLQLDSLYTLAMNSPKEAGYFLKQSPRIIKNDNNF